MYFDFFSTARKSAVTLRRRSKSRPSAGRRRLRLEPLEDRRLLAAYGWDSAAHTVAVTLGTGQSVLIAESAGTRTLTLSTGSWTAARDAATVAGTQLRFLPGNDISTSISVDNTGAGAGTNNVTWGGGTIVSATIVVNANASSTTSAIYVSGGTTLQGNAALTANGAAISQGALPLAVTGTLTLSADAAHDITLNIAGNDFSTVAITGGKNVTLVDQNALTLGNVATFGTLAVTATAMNLNGGSVTTAGRQTYTGPVSLGAATALDSGGGNILLTSLTGAQNLTLAAGIGAGTVTATGAVAGLGNGVGAALTVANGVTGLVWFKDPWGGNSGLMAAAGTSLRFDHDVTLADGDTATNLAGNVTLDGLNWSSYDGITFGPVTLSAAAVSLDSHNGRVGLGPVTVTGTRALSLTAGSGDILLNGAVGSSSNGLGAVTIVSAHDVTVAGSGWASSLTVTATGSTSLQAVTVGKDGLTLTGANLALHNPLVTTSDGLIAITESGTVTIDAAADINSLGAVSIAGSRISTAGDIATNSDTVDLHGPVTLTGNVAINTVDQGSGHGAGITFWGTLDGASALTLTAGTNSGSSPFNAIAFQQQVGAPASEPVLTIVSAFNVSVSAGIQAVSLTQVAGSGTTTLMGAVDTSGVNSSGNGLELVTNNLVVNDSLTSHNHPISLRASGGLTVSATLGTVVDSGTSPDRADRGQ